MNHKLKAENDFWNRSKIISCALPIVVLCCGIISFFYFYQLPGISIGILALAAGIMSVRSNMPMPEKRAWVGLLIVLTVLDVLAINKNEKINQSIRGDQNNKFEQIANKLDDNIGNITGGNSYAYLDIEKTPNPPFELALVVKGEHPIRNVIVTMQQVIPVYVPDANINLETKDFIGNSRWRTGVPVQSGRYIFVIAALNGQITEGLDIAKCSDGTWDRAIMLSGAGHKDNEKLKGKDGCHKPF